MLGDNNVSVSKASIKPTNIVATQQLNKTFTQQRILARPRGILCIEENILVSKQMYKVLNR